MTLFLLLLGCEWMTCLQTPKIHDYFIDFTRNVTSMIIVTLLAINYNPDRCEITYIKQYVAEKILLTFHRTQS